ncbi:MAG: hypothetical protein ACTIKT_06035, partial [Microbacterium sp.]
MITFLLLTLRFCSLRLAALAQRVSSAAAAPPPLNDPHQFSIKPPRDQARAFAIISPRGFS